MNWKQMLTTLKAVLVAAGPSALEIMKLLGYDPTTPEKIIAAAISIVGIVLLVLEKTERAIVLDAKDIDGVQVHVNTLQAPAPVVAAARDPNVPDVVPMIGGPRTDTNKQQ